MGEELLFRTQFLWQGHWYPIYIYRHRQARARCSHMAATTLAPGDTIITDGRSVEEVLLKQQRVLPVAILSRALV
jgi:hypothetical protein